MNLELDEDQRDLIAVTTEVCSAVGAHFRSVSSGKDRDEVIRKINEGLKALAEVGILGIRHPEPHGSGLGPVEAVLVAKTCGAALIPMPLLLWADLVGPNVPGVLEGAVSITGSFERTRGFSFGGHTDVVVAVDDTGAAYAFESSAVAWNPIPQVDPATPRARLVGDIPSDSQAIASPDTVREWRGYAALIAAAHLVGVGGAAVATSTAYTRERHQFGVAIGSFQAIKHLLADAYTAVELAYSQLLIAALCRSEGNESGTDQTAAAGIVSARAAIAAAETAIQVHGGMGFTAEALPHLYYKRSLLLAAELQTVSVRPRELLHRSLAVHGPSPDTRPAS